MTDLHPEIEITEEQAEAIAKGLYAVAKADGEVHPAEAALIKEFFRAISNNPADWGSLEREEAIPAETLAEALPSKELRMLFIKTALLLAFTDGSYGEGEKTTIGNYAAVLELSTDEQAALLVEVKEYLLHQLSHLKNVDASIAVAKELDI